MRESGPVGRAFAGEHIDMPLLRPGKTERESSNPNRPVRKSLSPADREMLLIAFAAAAVLSMLLVIRVTHRGAPVGPGQMVMIGFVVSAALWLVHLSAAHRK
jgi:hypothetical protein